MAQHTVTLTDASFAKAVGKGGLVLVDFYADWCPPCHAVTPVLEDLAGELAGQVTFARLDVDRNPRTAKRFDIESIPTLILFRGGQPVDAVVGAEPKARLRRWLGKHLGETLGERGRHSDSSAS